MIQFDLIRVKTGTCAAALCVSVVLGGCGDEQKYKNFLRRHTLPTQVWYKAYPGLTAIDLERNGRIRQGLESASLNEHEAREWVALL